MFLRIYGRQLGALSRLLVIVLPLAISACGGSASSNGSNATTVVTATAPLPGGYLVSWTPVPDSRVTGYKLYYSTTPLDHGGAQSVFVGAMTNYSFNPFTVGITAGATVYFAVSALGSGAESAMSLPVSIVVQ